MKEIIHQKVDLSPKADQKERLKVGLSEPVLLCIKSNEFIKNYSLLRNCSKNHTQGTNNYEKKKNIDELMKIYFRYADKGVLCIEHIGIFNDSKNALEVGNTELEERFDQLLITWKKLSYRGVVNPESIRNYITLCKKVGLPVAHERIQEIFRIYRHSKNLTSGDNIMYENLYTEFIKGVSQEFIRLDDLLLEDLSKESIITSVEQLIKTIKLARTVEENFENKNRCKELASELKKRTIDYDIILRAANIIGIMDALSILDSYAVRELLFSQISPEVSHYFKQCERNEPGQYMKFLVVKAHNDMQTDYNAHAVFSEGNKMINHVMDQLKKTEEKKDIPESHRKRNKRRLITGIIKILELPFAFCKLIFRLFRQYPQ